MRRGDSHLVASDEPPNPLSLGGQSGAKITGGSMRWRELLRDLLRYLAPLRGIRCCASELNSHPFLATCSFGPCSRACAPHLARTQGLHLVAIIRAAVGDVGCQGAAHRQGHSTSTCWRPRSRIA